MTTQSLYRKYRPRTYDEVAGQEHVTMTLRNAVRQGQVGHAYLFAGPRGTGKTSMARILAKAVNCLSEQEPRPCNACARCRAIDEGRLLDLVEIDAASNRGIDEVRELREKVSFVPSDSNFKVYILDEAHMLTEPAFNALLKTLEEPPKHVIFVLVTTEPHAILPTIRSRCQRFDFQRIPTARIIEHLQRISEEEQLDAEPAALEVIAASATGSMRDAISLLDQMRSYGQAPITADQVRAVLGTVAEQAIQDLVAHMVAGELPEGLGLINRLLSEGVEARQLLREVIEYLRRLLIMQVGGSAIAIEAPSEALTVMRQQAGRLGTEGIVRTIQLLSRAGEQLRGGAQSHLPLELAFLEAVMAGSGALPDRQGVAAAAPVAARQPMQRLTRADKPQAEGRPEAPAVAPSTETESAAKGRGATAAAVAAQAEPDSAAPGASFTLEGVQLRWNSLFAEVRKHSHKAEAALRSCQPVAVEGDLVVLAFDAKFHKDLVEDPKHVAAVEQALGVLMGGPARIRCVLKSEWVAPLAARAARESVPAAVGDPPERGFEESRGSDSTLPADENSTETIDPVVREAVRKYGGVLRDRAVRR